MTIPEKSAITNTYLLTLLFCLPFAGTEELFLFMVIGQLLFIILVFFCFRKDSPSLLVTCKNNYPVSFYLFICWLVATIISLVIIYNADTNGWRRAAAIARQLFIFIQIGFCLSLIRFLLVSGKPYIYLLFSFGMGFIGMVLLHFAVLYWGPLCSSETWLKDPFLSPNMRDMGDLATAAITIFSVMYWLTNKAFQAWALWLLATISWAYLLWSGGRTAIASAFAVILLIMIICRAYGKLPWKKILMTAFGLIVAYGLCVQFSIYEWNGIVRYSTEWKPDFNPQADLTSGRMDMWIWSIQVFLKNMWFGLGPYGFYFIPERFEHQFWHDHPHNLVIQCLIEWGIIGTTLFLAFLATLAITGLRNIKSMTISGNSDFLASGGIVLMLTLGSITGGSYWDFQPVIILVTAYACFPLLPALKAKNLRPKS